MHAGSRDRVSADGAASAFLPSGCVGNAKLWSAWGLLLVAPNKADSGWSLPLFSLSLMQLTAAGLGGLQCLLGEYNHLSQSKLQSSNVAVWPTEMRCKFVLNSH